MKKLLLLFSLLFCMNTFYGQGIQFIQNDDFKAVQAQAKEQNKPLFVDFMASWCGPCKMMSEKVFTDSVVGAYFNDKFLACKVDGDVHRDLSQKYQITGFPTMIWFDKDGKELKRIVGGVNPERLLHVAQEVCGERKGFTDLYKDYKAGSMATDDQLAMILEGVASLGDFPQEKQQMWGQRLMDAYKDCIDKNGMDILLSRTGLQLTTVFEKDYSKESDVMKFLNSKYDECLSILKDTVSLNRFLMNQHFSVVLFLAKKGDVHYLDELDRIKTDKAKVYSVVSHPVMRTYDLMKNIADASYYLYGKKDTDTYFQIKDAYLKVIGDKATVADYNSILNEVLSTVKQQMPKPFFEKCISLIDNAEKLADITPQQTMAFDIMAGQCYQGMKELDKAKEILSKASMTALQLGDNRARSFISQLLKSME